MSPLSDAIIDIVGGVYIEYCLHPGHHELLGSAGRAAHALHYVGIKPILHTYADDNTEKELKRIEAAGIFDVKVKKIDKTVSFFYNHGLSNSRIFSQQLCLNEKISVESNNILLYGMVEGSACINADFAVYDPQNVSNPVLFSENGSQAKNLAIVLNNYEARILSGLPNESIENQAKEIAKKDCAKVVVIKRGPDGALIYENDNFDYIPAYETDNVFKIGSGDIFSAYFAFEWMVNKKHPKESAEIASRAVANYCNTRMYPTPKTLLNYNPKPIVASNAYRKNTKNKVYLAGPFFTLAQLWMIDEAKRNLEDFGLEVFSPFHDIGKGSAEQVVASDLNGLDNSQIVFAIGDGLDSGTIFEIGYARAKNIPVVFYAENESDENQKMMLGSGCILCKDYVTAIYKTIWTLIQK